jgi:tetratricopeptide (TPR) repeat protein
VTNGRNDNAADDEIARLTSSARAQHEAGAPLEAYQPAINRAYALLGDRRDLRWARLRVLEPPRLEPVAVPGKLFNVEVWRGYEEEVVDLLRSSEDEDDVAQSLWNFPWAPREQVEEIWRLAEKWSKPEPRYRALTYVGESLLYRHGRPRDAIHAFEESLALSEAEGWDTDAAKALVRLTLAQVAQGELATARATEERTLAAVRALDAGVQVQEHPGDVNRDIYPKPSIDANFACYFDGDWQQIADHWAHAATLPERGPVATVEVGMAAHAFARAGRHDQVIPLITSLEAALRGLDPRVWAANGAVGRAARAIWEIGDARFAGAYRELAEKLVDAGVGDWPTTSNHLTIACMSALCGDADRARDHFHRARDTTDPLGHRPQRAIIDFDEAVALRGIASEADRRRSLLDAAAAEFEALEMSGWAARAMRERDAPPDAQPGSGYPRIEVL